MIFHRIGTPSPTRATDLPLQLRKLDLYHAIKVAHLLRGWLGDAVGSEHCQHEFSRGQRLFGRPERIEA
jgi:hypothetical protein